MKDLRKIVPIDSYGSTARPDTLCLACANGYHEQPLHGEECACPCHGPIAHSAVLEVAA